MKGIFGMELKPEHLTPWYSNMDPSSGNLYITDNDKKDGMYVRCIKNSSTEIDDVNNQSFNIYPNPANDNLTIRVAENKFSKLTIFNIVGDVVLTKKLNNNASQINISSLADGVYIIQLSGTNGIIQQKLIKE